MHLAGPVLVIDDDTSTRDLIVAVLRDEGYAVLAARDGADALRLADANPPALIMVDARMPGMDGAAFARAYLSARGPHAPLIVTSALGEGAVPEIPAHAVLHKPFDLDDLLRLVGEHARREPASGP